MRFSDDDAVTQAVIAAVQAEGTIWLGGTTWRGKAAMRISVANWSTRESDADRATAAILALSRGGTRPPTPIDPGARRRSRPSSWRRGAGSRFGGGKLLAPLEGRPVLQHVLDTLAVAGLEVVVIVLGEDAGAMERALQWRTERRVRNPDPLRGLASSLQVGLAAAGERERRVAGQCPDRPR